MRKSILILVLALSMNVMAQESPDWAELQKKFYAEFQATSPAQQFELVESFLRKYPQMLQAERILSLGINLCLNDLNSPEKGENLIREFLKAENRTEIQVFAARLELVKVLGALRKTDELQGLISELTQKELNAFQYGSIAQAALDAQLYEFTLTICKKIESQITPDSMKKSFGNNEELARILFTRMHCENLTRRAAAFIGLGKLEDALLEAEKAEATAPASFLGITTMKYPYIKGMAHNKLGNLNLAMDSWAPAAIFQHDGKSLEALKDAYLELGNDEKEFELFLSEKRKKIAQMAPDFTLKTYDGEEVTLSSCKGKVVVLNFWSYG